MIPRLKQLFMTLLLLAWSGFCFWAAISGLQSGAVLAPSRGGHGSLGSHGYEHRASDPGWFWTYEALWLILGCVYPVTSLIMGRWIRSLPIPARNETSPKQYESKKRRMMNRRTKRH